MNEANSFVVYDDIEAVLDKLTDEQVGQLFRGMVSYHKGGQEPDLDELLSLVFIPIKQGMDRNADKYAKKCERNRENGKLGGRPSKPTETERFSENRTVLKKANTNTNINTNTESDTDTKSTPVDVWSLSRSVLGYLNDRAGTSYRTDKAEYVKLISELSHQGYTEADMVRVVDVKCADWLNNAEMAQFLRPSTLFGDKFGEYLAQPLPEAVAKRERAEKRSADNAKRVEAFKSELVTVQERIASADTATRIQLREREAWLQDEIARLSG